MIYLDTCLLIHLIETEGAFRDRVRAAMHRSRMGVFAISPLVVHEVLVGALRGSSSRTLDIYAAAFAEYRLVSIDMQSYVHAARLRAENPGLKTVDALHLAAAQDAGCEALWTNDQRLAAASGCLAVDVIGAPPPPRTRRTSSRSVAHAGDPRGSAGRS